MYTGMPGKVLVPGWLKIGLGLCKGSKLYRVTAVGDIVTLMPLGTSTKKDLQICLEDLPKRFLSSTYFECDDCQRKPGSPELCPNCYDRRKSFAKSGNKTCTLPRFCETAYIEYPDCYLNLIPEPSTRAETGVIAFGDDWPGVFIRGDDAFGYAHSLRIALEALDGVGGATFLAFQKPVLQGLLTLLDRSRVREGFTPGDLQRMKPFGEAKGHD
jgi:hypothetical protein